MTVPNRPSLLLQKCNFCGSDENNELLYGAKKRLNNVVTHYYCILLASRIEQKGEDTEGLLGFMLPDILKEINRGKRLKCAYCKRTGATIGCVKPRCPKSFHLPCGVKHGSLHQFFGQYKSFCHDHRPKQKIPQKILSVIGSSTATCSICFEDIESVISSSTLWAPCCQKESWFHRDCVQNLANSAGYFFKCPLCNNKEIFHKAMLDCGIYIPEQDASWETVPNAFEELLHRHDQCDAKKCLSPRGRKVDEKNTRWELALCESCGSQGMHIACGKLKWSNPEFECADCLSMVSSRNLQENEPSRDEVADQMDDDEVSDVEILALSPIPETSSKKLSSTLAIKTSPHSSHTSLVPLDRGLESSQPRLTAMTNCELMARDPLSNLTDLHTSVSSSTSQSRVHMTRRKTSLPNGSPNVFGRVNSTTKSSDGLTSHGLLPGSSDVEIFTSQSPVNVLGSSSVTNGNSRTILSVPGERRSSSGSRGSNASSIYKTTSSTECNGTIVSGNSANVVSISLSDGSRVSTGLANSVGCIDSKNFTPRLGIEVSLTELHSSVVDNKDPLHVYDSGPNTKLNMLHETISMQPTSTIAKQLNSILDKHLPKTLDVVEIVTPDTAMNSVKLNYAKSESGNILCLRDNKTITLSSSSGSNVNGADPLQRRASSTESRYIDVSDLHGNRRISILKSNNLVVNGTSQNKTESSLDNERINSTGLNNRVDSSTDQSNGDILSTHEDFVNSNVLCQITDVRSLCTVKEQLTDQHLVPTFATPETGTYESAHNGVSEDAISRRSVDKQKRKSVKSLINPKDDPLSLVSHTTKDSDSNNQVSSTVLQGTIRSRKKKTKSKKLKGSSAILEENVLTGSKSTKVSKGQDESTTSDRKEDCPTSASATDLPSHPLSAADVDNDCSLEMGLFSSTSSYPTPPTIMRAQKARRGRAFRGNNGTRWPQSNSTEQILKNSDGSSDPNASSIGSITSSHDVHKPECNNSGKEFDKVCSTATPLPGSISISPVKKESVFVNENMSKPVQEASTSKSFISESEFNSTKTSNLRDTSSKTIYKISDLVSGATKPVHEASTSIVHKNDSEFDKILNVARPVQDTSISITSVEKPLKILETIEISDSDDDDIQIVDVELVTNDGMKIKVVQCEPIDRLQIANSQTKQVTSSSLADSRPHNVTDGSAEPVVPSHKNVESDISIIKDVRVARNPLLGRRVHRSKEVQMKLAERRRKRLRMTRFNSQSVATIDLCKDDQPAEKIKSATPQNVDQNVSKPVQPTQSKGQSNIPRNRLPPSHVYSTPIQPTQTKSQSNIPQNHLPPSHVYSAPVQPTQTKSQSNIPQNRLPPSHVYSTPVQPTQSKGQSNIPQNHLPPSHAYSAPVRPTQTKSSSVTLPHKQSSNSQPSSLNQTNKSQNAHPHPFSQLTKLSNSNNSSDINDNRKPTALVPQRFNRVENQTQSSSKSVSQLLLEPKHSNKRPRFEKSNVHDPQKSQSAGQNTSSTPQRIAPRHSGIKLGIPSFVKSNVYDPQTSQNTVQNAGAFPQLMVPQASGNQYAPLSNVVLISNQPNVGSSHGKVPQLVAMPRLDQTSYVLQSNSLSYVENQQSQSVMSSQINAQPYVQQIDSNCVVYQQNVSYNQTSYVTSGTTSQSFVNIQADATYVPVVTNLPQSFTLVSDQPQLRVTSYVTTVPQPQPQQNVRYK